jgi:hypothetical protein
MKVDVSTTAPLQESTAATRGGTFPGEPAILAAAAFFLLTWRDRERILNRRWQTTTLSERRVL